MRITSKGYRGRPIHIRYDTGPEHFIGQQLRQEYPHRELSRPRGNSVPMSILPNIFLRYRQRIRSPLVWSWPVSLISLLMRLAFACFLMLYLLSLPAQTGPGGVGDFNTNGLWLRADALDLSDGAAVAEWADQSGYANTARQSNANFPTDLPD